ncbi:hypothetical protein KC19_2G223800 [Ceratodon purpureus]|uniref:Uncharacterized protein n=1 Tax=Ceratodon purpureus TaxID=3225 RepID=A0A8T0J0M3_CERPU|nr:hypothetical protein KC19_2G223800 [Ceratodon purpureus]
MAMETGTGGLVMEGRKGEEVETVLSGAESLERAVGLLQEHGLPDGLLPMQDVVEVGYNRETGFVWVTQKKPIVHNFKQISKQVSYGDKITAYLEKGRLKKLTGVKAKELFWVSIVDIAMDESDPEKIFFKSFAGIGKNFPVKAFAKGA